MSMTIDKEPWNLFPTAILERFKGVLFWNGPPQTRSILDCKVADKINKSNIR